MAFTSERMRRNNYAYQPISQPNSSHDPLEEENERLAGELKDKVEALKHLSIHIGDEVKYQDKLLRGLDDDMDRTGGFLSNTMNRVIRLGKGGHNKQMLYMFLFAMFVFFVLYITLKFR